MMTAKLFLVLANILAFTSQSLCSTVTLRISGKYFDLETDQVMIISPPKKLSFFPKQDQKVGGRHGCFPSIFARFALAIFSRGSLRDGFHASPRPRRGDRARPGEDLTRDDDGKRDPFNFLFAFRNSMMPGTAQND